MMHATEAVVCCRFSQCGLKRRFNGRFKGDVDDHTTLLADQMVVMLPGYFFGEFKPGVVVGGDNPLHHSNIF